jgi:hypothetical protein
MEVGRTLVLSPSTYKRDCYKIQKGRFADEMAQPHTSISDTSSSIAHFMQGDHTLATIGKLVVSI